MTATIRVGTWNIREGVPVSVSKESGRPKLITTLAQSDLDVLALQEVTFTDDGRSSELEAITGNTDLKHACTYSLSPSSFHPGHRSGLAVVSRIPQSGLARVPLPNPHLRQQTAAGLVTSWEKGMLAACLEADLVQVWVASVHGYPFHKFGRDARDHEFGQIWRSLATAVDRLPPGPIVVSGDFNTKHLGLLTKRLERRMAPVIENAGLTGDDILYSAGLTMRNFTITETFSDHPLLSTEFAVGGDLS